MSEIMTHEHWMKHSDGGITSVRSGRLKAVDAALLQYHRTRSDADKNRLRTALVAWMGSKGSAWKTSVRNRYNAVDDLCRQVMDIPGAAISGLDIVALSHLKHEQEAILEDLFRNRKLEWRDGIRAKLANNKFGTTANTGGAAKNIRTLAKPGAAGGEAGAGRAAKLASELVDTLVPFGIRAEVMAEVGRIIPDFMKELTASLTPFVGVVTAGGAAVWNVKSALVNVYRIDRAEMHLARSLSVENPEQAIRAVIRILERERNADAFSASVSIGEFAGKLASALADGGTATNAAIGLAANVAKLANIIRIVKRDVEEKNAANRLMQGRVGILVVETSPIVGAYYVCCAPTSVLVNEILERFGHAGWRGEVERTVVNHVEPIREQARRLIREHRFVIKGLETYPGVLTPNEKELDRMEKGRGRSGMEGFGSDSLPPELVATRPRR